MYRRMQGKYASEFFKRGQRQTQAFGHIRIHDK
jgi:hypothetical protein